MSAENVIHPSSQEKKGLKMPMNFGHVDAKDQPQKQRSMENTYCKIPNHGPEDFLLYNEHHLKNLLYGLNSDNPDVVNATKHLLSKYLEFRKTIPDDYTPPHSPYAIPTYPELIKMMSQKISVPKVIVSLKDQTVTLQ